MAALPSARVVGLFWKPEHVRRLRAELALAGLAPLGDGTAGPTIEPHFTVSVPADWGWGGVYAALTLTNLRRFPTLFWARGRLDLHITWRDPLEEGRSRRARREWIEDRQTEHLPVPPDWIMEVPHGPRRTLAERAARLLVEHLKTGPDQSADDAGTVES